MPMSGLYKQQFVSALLKYQGIRHFKDEMFVFENEVHQPFYFWIVDNGGEVLVELVNSFHPPVNIPIAIYSCIVTPTALSSAVRDACLAFCNKDNRNVEIADVWLSKIIEWIAWVQKYNQHWDHKTDGITP